MPPPGCSTARRWRSWIPPRPRTWPDRCQRVKSPGGRAHRRQLSFSCCVVMRSMWPTVRRQDFRSWASPTWPTSHPQPGGADVPLKTAAALPGLRLEKFDAIIVGSGAAGSAVAARLAEGGKRVVILEAGPARTAADLVSSTLYARRMKWTGPEVLDEGRNPVDFVFNAGFGTGGSAMHHYAVWPRMHAEDFDMRSRHDRGLDWPFGYEELRPYYDQVQQEVGIAGDARQEVWRPAGAPYPMPAVPVFAQGAAIARGFKHLGKTIAPLPLAVTTTNYQGRAKCLWDGWCDSGCPIGALANPLTIHLPRALAAGATLVNNAPVTRVVLNSAGTHAVGVEVAQHHTLHADVIVLAAFTV